MTTISESGNLNNLEIQATGINVIVKSPTLESLTSKSFEEYVNNLELENAMQQTASTTEPVKPKPKRRFVFNDDSLEKEKEKEEILKKREPSSKVDRKFERLSSEIEDLEQNAETYKQEFEATFADLKNEASQLQSEFSKLSWGDDSNSTATTGGEFGSNTPDTDLQGD